MGLFKFLVLWGPTILFSLILLSGFLTGVVRGLRRSRVFFIHRLIAGAIALTLFLLCVNSTYFDKGFLSFISLFGVDMHDIFNVSSSIDTLKGVLTAGIPSLIKDTDGALAVALSENSRYILALVNLIYSMTFGFICLVIYYLIKFILFLCYCLFYPEWKYVKKYKKKVEKNEDAKPYKKRRLAGGLVGLFSSFLVAIVSFSFIGNVMYIAVGTGDKGLPNYRFNDSSTREVYNTVGTIESYGTKGVFKLLNLAKYKNGVPLYLYPAGFIFSGKMEDSVTNESERVYFTYEMANYTEFLRETASLAIEYCGSEIDNTIAGEEVEVMQLVKDLLTNDVFRLKFRELLNEYTEKSTFVGEFMFDLIDSYCANISESSIASSLSEDAVELMEILFVKGYISPVIYFEEKYTESNKVLPYIKLSDVVSKKDLLVVYDIFTELVDKGLLDENYDVMDMVVSVCSHLEEFKVFNSSNANKSNINGVLGRLYSYAEIKLLGVSSTESIENYTTNVDIKWTDEIIALAEKSTDIQIVYNKVKQLQESGANTRECFEGLFDDATIVNAYDSVVDYVSNSLLTGRVMDSNYVYGMLEDLILQNASGYTTPKDLCFRNQTDESGNIVYGELFRFMQAIKQFGTRPATRDLLINIIDGGDADVLQQLKAAESDLKEVDSYGISIVSYLKDSTLLRAVGSAFLINASKQDEVPIYIPNLSKEKDAYGEYIDVIKKEEYDLLIDSLFTKDGSVNSKDYGFIALIPDGVKVSDSNFKNEIFEANDNLFENNVIINLINNSYIFQATFGKFVINNTESLGDIITLTPDLMSPADWVSSYKVENNEKVLVKQSETVKVFDALHELFGTSKKLKDIDSAFDEILKTDKLSQFNYPAINVTSIFVDDEGVKENVSTTEVIYNSVLIRGTISSFICNNLPDDLKTEGLEKAKGEDGIITIEEFSTLIELVDFLDINDVTNQDSFNCIDDYMNNLSGVITLTKYGQEDEKEAKLLDLIYQSSPIKYYFSKVIDDALVKAIGEDDDDRYKLDFIKDENNLYTYEQSTDIINSLVVCDVDNAESSSDKIVEAFQHFNDVITFEDYPEVLDQGETTTRLDVFYKSNVMVILLTDSLEEQIQSNDMLQDHVDAKESVSCGENSYYQYKKFEIEQLVKFIDGKSIDGSSANQFEASSIEIQRVRDEFFDHDTKLCNSKLLLSSISLNLLENEAVTTGSLIIPNTAIVELTDVTLIVDAELYNVLSFACDLGVSSIDNVNNTMQNDSMLKLNVISSYTAEGVQNTDIIRTTVSDRIIENNVLSVPKSVLDNNFEDYKVVNAKELSTLFTLVQQIGIDNMGGVKSLNVDEISLIVAKSWIAQSEIIHATTSVKIIDNCSDDSDYLIIPVVAKVKKNSQYVDSYVISKTLSAKDFLDELTLISVEELTYLFDALISIDIDTVSTAYGLTENDFNPVNFTDNQINRIALSSILRATITQNVKFNSEGEDIIPKAFTSEVDHGEIYVDTKINQNKIGILHDHEIVHLLVAIRTFKQDNNDGSAFTCKFTNAQLINLYNSGKLSTILESDIFRVAISDSFINKGISLTTSNQSLYCFDLRTDSYFPVASANTIMNYIRSIQYS